MRHLGWTNKETYLINGWLLLPHNLPWAEALCRTCIEKASPTCFEDGRQGQCDEAAKEFAKHLQALTALPTYKVALADAQSSTLSLSDYIVAAILAEVNWTEIASEWCHIEMFETPAAPV